MLNAATYTAMERLRDGRTCEIRALKPNDEADLLTAVGRIGAQSLYRRFMGARTRLWTRERAFFLNVDFVNHVALVAVVKEGDRAAIVAVGRPMPAVKTKASIPRRAAASMPAKRPAR